MIEGMDAFLSKLTAMAEIEDELFASVDQCGEFVRDDARLRAPVDTSDLRKSIDHTTSKENAEIVSEIHTNSDHAVYVEFGTGPVGAANHEGTSPEVSVTYSPDKWKGVIPGLVSDTDSGIRYIAGQAAQPYMYPALKDNEDQIIEKINSDVIKAVEDKTK
ncbi:MAG: HK97 gp10 family phage protein [Lachnospiraceae bacterium]|nr:HK97 gp10 family phage protein [Lachnospiraceae bacterium]